MLLISSTRSLSTARPITDPILNCHHIQPAAAVGPWLCQTHTPSSPNSFTSPYSPACHLDQLFTTPASAPTLTKPSLQLPPLPPLTPHSPTSASSSSPSTFPQTFDLTATASSPSYHPPPIRTAPATATMQPTANTISDDDSSTPEEDQSLSATQINPSPHPLGLYDLAATSSVPPTSASSSSFPLPPTQHQPSNFPSHPDHKHHHQNQQQHHQQHHHHHQQQQQQQHHHHHHQHQQQQRSQHSQQQHTYLHSPTLHSPSHHSSQVQHSFDQRHNSNLLLAHPSYHSRPQSAPHPTARSGLDPSVLAAASTKVEVKRWDEEGKVYFQVANGGHTVGRLRDSGMVNGTKLLNMAGITRGKRDGILKNEKIRKVVKHGTMHLKGVWITFERAQALAEQYKVNEKVFPLLVTNLEDYINVDQAIMVGGSKLALQPIMQHHQSRHHPYAQQQPAKFAHLGLTISPNSAGPHGYSSAAGWAAGPSSAATVGYNEPYSAPAVAQNATGSAGAPSMYAQAQQEFLHSAGSTKSNISERRQTLASNTYNGYHSMASFGSPSTTLSYPSSYGTAQYAGYPSRAGTSEMTSPSQFEYPLGTNHNMGFGNNSASGAAYQASLYHPHLGSAPSTACSAATKPSPAFHSAQLAGAASPGLSPAQLVGPVDGSFRRGERPAGLGSSGGIKRELSEAGADDAQFRRLHVRTYEESPNESSGSFRGSIAGSKAVSGSLGDWNVSQATMISTPAGGIATTNQGEEAQSRSATGESPIIGSGQVDGSSGSSNDDPQQLWHQQTKLPEASFHVGGAHPESSSHHQWQS